MGGGGEGQSWKSASKWSFLAVFSKILLRTPSHKSVAMESNKTKIINSTSLLPLVDIVDSPNGLPKLKVADYAPRRRCEYQIPSYRKG